MVHAALLLLMLEAVTTDLVFTISLKRSTQNLQLSTSCRPITPSIGSLRETDQPGAHFPVMPPDHPVCAILERTVSDEEQPEFVGNFESICMDTDAPVGDVGNDAVERRGADPELDLR